MATIRHYAYYGDFLTLLCSIVKCPFCRGFAPSRKRNIGQVWRPIVRDEERSGQENREESLVAKPLPKNSFQKFGEAIDFQEANPLISTHKAFSRSCVAGFRAGKLSAVADKNLTRDGRL